MSLVHERFGAKLKRTGRVKSKTDGPRRLRIASFRRDDGTISGIERNEESSLYNTVKRSYIFELLALRFGSLSFRRKVLCDGKARVGAANAILAGIQKMILERTLLT
jgi:hypothetical protein